MPDTVVAMFPGQGSLAAGVGRPWADHDAFKTVDAVSEVTGSDVRHLLVDAHDDELVSTRNAQLATFALSLGIFAQTGIGPSVDWALGHSLGEYSALVAAEVLALDDAARLVDARGTAMLAAAVACPGGLTALIGGDAAAATALCGAVEGLYVANRNGPGQVVVGGTQRALAEGAQRAKEFGFRRAIALPVGGAFHTPLMASATDALASAIASSQFSPGRASVVANVDGAVHVDPRDWPGLLVRQLTEPVDWDRSVRSLPTGAIAVEFGPGGVLSGLVKRIRDDVTCINVGVPDDLGSIGGFL